MPQAHSRGDASLDVLDVQDNLTVDERAGARTAAQRKRDAARRSRATPAQDPLALRYRRRAERGRLHDAGVLVAVWTHNKASDSVETNR